LAESKPRLLEEINAREIAEEIRKHASNSQNEEELKIRVESLLRQKVADKLGIPWASYEHRNVASGRKDAFYGRVIIEYKDPGKLDIKSEFNKAKEKVKEYIIGEAKDPASYGEYFGVILDGFKISFLRYRKGAWEEQNEAIEVNPRNITRFLEVLRGLKRKPIDAELLLLDFGPRSEISRKTILLLYEKLESSKSERTKMLFEDWKRVFSQVCAYSPEKLAELTKYYGIEKNVDVEKLLFSVHTYYTLLMKFLTSEVITLFTDGIIGSYLRRLEDAYFRSHKELLVELKDLEEGGIFNQLGIKNFLEADYFAWYPDEWDEKLASSIIEIVKGLLEYEPATVELDPDRVKDLFKRLYQNLVPKKVRHDLGEYFTPDWLAELLINEVGYDGNPEKRVLDPACGSGTFLVLAIKKVREYATEHFVDEGELIKKIIENVRGIDLNPLAVLASKANYIIALSDLLRYRPREGIEIPIYLADSVSVIRKATLYGEDEYELNTNEGKFWVTKEVIDKNLLYPVLRVINEGAKLELSKEEFRKFLSKNIPLSRASIESFLRLYEKILKLERFGKNKIWTSLLKNSFSPMLIGKFDYVVGNPPWINWESLPEFYRDSTKFLWGEYGLLEKTKGMGLGKVKRDMAMLFVARCFDQYANESGKLAFLIPFTAFKTQAGAGFRRKLTTMCEVEKIHDLVELYPFEGAINRTSLIVIKRGKTMFPIPCVMWHNPKSKGIDQEAELEKVKKTTKQFDMILTPIQKGKPETSWMIISEKAYMALQKAIKKAEYEAHAGTFTALNSVYWVEIISKHFDEFLVKNLATIGKKKVKEVREIVESELLYPLVRGQDHKMWYINPSGYILIPTDKNGEILSHSELKTNFPKTYQYFLNFVKNLVNRDAEPYKSKLEPYRKKVLAEAEKKAPPFYWLFNVKPSMSPYKVAWKYIAGKISGKGEFSVAVIEPFDDKYLGKKIIIPNEKLMQIPFEDKNEAYYVNSVLNSSIAQLIVMSYIVETAISTHVLKNVYVPKFKPENKLHLKLLELSKKAHELAKKYYEQNDLVAQNELKQIEEENDKTVAELYGINDKELKEIKKTLRILKEGES
jgi:SAM-dependent methyltransferase